MPHVNASGSAASGSSAGSSTTDRGRSDDPNDCDEIKVYSCEKDETERESGDVLTDDKRDIIRSTECDQVRKQCLHFSVSLCPV